MRFLLAFVSTFLVLVALYLAAYREVDPDSEYGTGTFPAPLANARETKQKLFKAYAASHPVDGLILGSSRSMLLEPALADRLSGHTFFNFSVQNAMVEDYLAIYRWVREQGVEPKMLVVGVDVEAFDPADKIDERLRHNEPLFTALNGSPPSSLSSLAETVTRSGDELNIENAEGIAKGVELKLRPAKQTDVVEADGHTEYPLDDELVRSGKFDLERLIGQTIPTYAANYRNMDRLSPRREQWLRDLVSEAQSRGAKVILWVPPLHPETVRALNQSTPYGERLKDVVAFVENLATEFPGTVSAYDLSSPDKFGGNDQDWRDGAHMNKRNADRALKAMFAPNPVPLSLRGTSRGRG
jgi:hypothetical protein